MVFTINLQFLNDIDPFLLVTPEPARSKPFKLDEALTLGDQLKDIHQLLSPPHKLENCALQINATNVYLDLDEPITNQPEDCGIKQFSLVLVRTKPAIRAEVVIRALKQTDVKELRKTIFTLRRMFKEDETFVQEFIFAGGLRSLMGVARNAEQLTQVYVLRALGNVICYVDGMEMLIKSPDVIHDIVMYAMVDSTNLSKAALELLVVVADYRESSGALIIDAFRTISKERKMPLFKAFVAHISSIGDEEVQTYSLTLVNKLLHSTDDEDTFYDLIDHLELGGISKLKKPASGPFREQLLAYDQIVKEADEGKAANASAQSLALAKSSSSSKLVAPGPTASPQKPLTSQPSSDSIKVVPDSQELSALKAVETLASTAIADAPLSPRQSGAPAPSASSPAALSGSAIAADPTGALSRGSVGNSGSIRQKRMERNMKMRVESIGSTGAAAVATVISAVEDSNMANEKTSSDAPGGAASSAGSDAPTSAPAPALAPAAPPTAATPTPTPTPAPAPAPIPERPASFKRSSSYSMATDTDGSSGGITPIIEGSGSLPAKSLPGTILADTSETPAPTQPLQPPRKRFAQKEFVFRNYDFSDLTEEDEVDPLAPPPAAPADSAAGPGGLPPPPPPMGGGPPPPPPLLPGGPPPPPPPQAPWAPGGGSGASDGGVAKEKLVMKQLHWTKINQPQPLPSSASGSKTVWTSIPAVAINSSKWTQLFGVMKTASIDKDARSEESAKPKKISVLDNKRSNAVAIAITKLPSARHIKDVILTHDDRKVTKEDIRRLLELCPTDEEQAAIQAAASASPDLPLDSAEEYLTALGNIPLVQQRLKVWLFLHDFDEQFTRNADQLQAIKLAIQELSTSKSLETLLALVLAIGNHLNAGTAKGSALGFQLDILNKLGDTKDVTGKVTLLQHIASLVLDEYPSVASLYSELSHVVDVTKMDIDLLESRISKLLADVLSMGDLVSQILASQSSSTSGSLASSAASQTGESPYKERIPKFIVEAQAQCQVLEATYMRLRNRFSHLLLYFGISPATAGKTKMLDFFGMISEFSFDFKISIKKASEQKELAKMKRERNKTRGQKITLGAAAAAGSTSGTSGNPATNSASSKTVDTGKSAASAAPASSSGSSLLVPPNPGAGEQGSATDGAAANNSDEDEEMMSALAKTLIASGGSATSKRKKQRKPSCLGSRTSIRAALATVTSI